ncbi:MAG: response regulator [Candidatus Thorarchaeota archaeon]|nr:response regulator [Candidatus Thorarchaeota archaeon]
MPEGRDRPVIMLIDDNPDDVELTLHALNSHKLANEVVVARDGAEALAYLFGEGTQPENGQHTLPHLVLLDLNMPKVGGLDVLRRIRAEESTKTLLVVILTTSREERDIIDSYNLGANSYIVKPVDFEQFAAAIEQLELYWLVLNVLPE